MKAPTSVAVTQALLEVITEFNRINIPRVVELLNNTYHNYDQFTRGERTEENTLAVFRIILKEFEDFTRQQSFRGLNDPDA